MDIFSEKHAVGFTEVDTSGTLTPAAAFDLFQTAAIDHAEHLGVGWHVLQKAGQVWILSRMSVFAERRPAFEEAVTIRTWPRGANRLFAVRDYDILGADGKAAVRGRGGWLILDIAKRRPLRPQSQVETLPFNDGLDALAGEAGGNEVAAALEGRIDSTSPQKAKTTRKACYSDIDKNGHMNNARYIQWIQDLFAPEIFEAAGQIRLDINYLSEVKYGDTVELCTMPFTDGRTLDVPKNPLAAFAIEGKLDGTQNENVFRAELRTGK